MTTLNRFCLVASLASLLLAPRPVQDSGPATRPAFEVRLDTGPIVDAVAAERAANQHTFEEQYLAVKELIFGDAAGKWIAIVGGELLPTDVKGVLQPETSLDTLLGLLEAKHPKARHRFIFRVGEEGDLRYHFTLCNRPEFVGHNLLTQIGHVWIAAVEGAFKMPNDGPFTKEAIPLGRGDGVDIVAEIGEPGSKTLTSTDFLAANIYGGTAVISSKKAHALRLDRWEVPGRVISAGRHDMRRARLTFRIAKIGFDRTLTVAVEDR